MDTIDIQKDENEGGEYITLVLNGEPVNGTFDCWGFVLATEFKLNRFEVMTCSCGNAGCAGIWEGTNIKYRRRSVEWRDIDCRLPKRFYGFDRIAYGNVVLKTYYMMEDIVRKREADGVDSDEMYGILSSCTMADFRYSWERSKKWYNWNRT